MNGADMNTTCPVSLDPEVRRQAKPWAILGLVSFPVFFLFALALFAAQAYGVVDAYTMFRCVFVAAAGRRVVSHLAVRKVQIISGETPEPWTRTLVVASLIVLFAIVLGTNWSSA